jgi:predicted ATP-dependent serine protease
MVDEPQDLEDMSDAQINALLQQSGITSRERRKTDWTVDELYDATLPAPRWIVPDLLPAGLASLAGRPKVGKSWLALQLAAAVARGRPFLECAVQRGPVLFVALEDPPRRLHDRLQVLAVPRGTPIQFSTAWPALNAGPSGLYDLQQCVAEMQPRLVVFDTLSQAIDSSPSSNSPASVTAVLASLQRIAHENNCCVLIVDHHKKPGQAPDVINDILGSTGKAAVIDTAWGLYKERGMRGATLRVTGRDVTACELTIEFDRSTDGWQLCPDPSEVPRESALTDVTRALAHLGGQATTSELAAALDMPVGNASRALSALVAAGWVRRLPRQGRRVPYQLLS